MIEIENSNLRELEEGQEQEIITLNIQDANQAWRNYWLEYFTEKFQDNELHNELKITLKERNYLASKINGLVNANNVLLEENIKLGEMCEKLKIEVIDLRRKVGSKPYGIFDVAGKLIKKNIQNHMLREQNQKLREKVEHPLNKIEPGKVEEVLLLRAKGLNYDEIATKTGVSKASISRYVSKNKERLRELELSLKSNPSI